ncbi:MAG: hypothetical protein ACI4MU_00755, partial [Candidatus Ventricola sp.]
RLPASATGGGRLRSHREAIKEKKQSGSEANPDGESVLNSIRHAAVRGRIPIPGAPARRLLHPIRRILTFPPFVAPAQKPLPESR